MKKFLYIVFFFSFHNLYSQNEFHVFPINHEETPGKSIGNGSLKYPWDLQTALNQDTSVVNGGDIIWLHDGMYNGRYKSSLGSTIENKFVTVSAKNKGEVIINGNVDSNLRHILTVTGPRVIYKDLELTFIGNFTRNAKDSDYKVTTGINHARGENCKFINLKIHNIPGAGIGSWNKTGGTSIENCFIYNVGIIRKNGRGGGEGIYVQNSSDTETRIIRNNVIFNTYYKGIEVWSANRDAKEEYVKNITLDNNIIFNSGLPVNFPVDNVIIASDDRNGINIAKNITLRDNILYHNSKFKDNKIKGQAPSLTLGFFKKTPVEEIKIDNNIILGRINALRLLHVKSLTFSNNTVYSGYLHINKEVIENLKGRNWKFNNNSIFTVNKKPYYLYPNKKYTNIEWNNTFDIENNSNTFNTISNFDLESVLDISESKYSEKSYRVTLFSKEEENVIVNFSNQEIKEGMQYTIRDVENLSEVLKTGIISKDKKIEFPMKLNKGSQTKSLDNFGVFILEFETPLNERVGFLRKIFGWLF